MTALPNRDRRAERREATRREIVDAAWEIARSDGLSAITLREVAERVGMRSPSLYSHFDSKNAIFDAMFGQAWTEWCAVFDASEPRPRGGPAGAAGRSGGVLRLRGGGPGPVPADEPAHASRTSGPATRPTRSRWRHTSGCARSCGNAGCAARPTWTCGPRWSVGSSTSNWPTIRAGPGGGASCRGWWTCTATRSACPARG